MHGEHEAKMLERKKMLDQLRSQHDLLKAKKIEKAFRVQQFDTPETVTNIFNPEGLKPFFGSEPKRPLTWNSYPLVSKPPKKAVINENPHRQLRKGIVGDNTAGYARKRAEMESKAARKLGALANVNPYELECKKKRKLSGLSSGAFLIPKPGNGYLFRPMRPMHTNKHVLLNPSPSRGGVANTGGMGISAGLKQHGEQTDPRNYTTRTAGMAMVPNYNANPGIGSRPEMVDMGMQRKAKTKPLEYSANPAGKMPFYIGYDHHQDPKRQPLDVKLQGTAQGQAMGAYPNINVQLLPTNKETLLDVPSRASQPMGADPQRGLPSSYQSVYDLPVTNRELMEHAKLVPLGSNPTMGSSASYNTEYLPSETFRSIDVENRANNPECTGSNPSRGLPSVLATDFSTEPNYRTLQQNIPNRASNPLGSDPARGIPAVEIMNFEPANNNRTPQLQKPNSLTNPLGSNPQRGPSAANNSNYESANNNRTLQLGKPNSLTNPLGSDPQRGLSAANNTNYKTAPGEKYIATLSRNHMTNPIGSDEKRGFSAAHSSNNTAKPKKESEYAGAINRANDPVGNQQGRGANAARNTTNGSYFKPTLKDGAVIHSRPEGPCSHGGFEADTRLEKRLNLESLPYNKRQPEENEARFYNLVPDKSRENPGTTETEPLKVYKKHMNEKRAMQRDECDILEPLRTNPFVLPVPRKCDVSA